jgi:signal transduction histidine kinase/CheY-like chemotaxis protein
LGIDERIGFLLDWLVGVAGADSAILYLQTPTGGLRRDASIGLAEIVTPPPRELLDTLANGPVLHAIEADLFGVRVQASACDHWIADSAAHTAVSVPLEIAGRILGLVQLGFHQRRDLAEAEAHRIGIIVDHMAAAIEAARLSRVGAVRPADAERIGALLDELDRMKSDFLSMVSHELRTPLTAIIGYTDLLLRQVHGSLNDRQYRYQSSVRRAAHRLLAIVNDLLDLNRLEGGHLTIAGEPLLIVDAVERAIADIESVATSRGITVQIQGQSQPLTVVADRERLRQILVHLLDNAVKFTPDGGAVAVSVVGIGAHASVMIVDAGVGIPKEQIDRIWDRFHQVDTSSRRQFNGTGLGLAIVKRLVELHGGTVSASSEGAGLGACFSFTLPLAETGHTEATSPAEPEPPTQLATAAQQRRILVVDDEPDNRDVIQSIVKDVLGYAVATASGGFEALEAARDRPDLILLDIRLPDLDGLEVTRRLKADPLTAGVPVLALTALADDDDRQHAIDAGCVGCITKPFNNEALAAAIAEVIGSAGAWR